MIVVLLTNPCPLLLYISLCTGSQEGQSHPLVSWRLSRKDSSHTYSVESIYLHPQPSSSSALHTGHLSQDPLPFLCGSLSPKLLQIPSTVQSSRMLCRTQAPKGVPIKLPFVTVLPPCRYTVVFCNTVQTLQINITNKITLHNFIY